MGRESDDSIEQLWNTFVAAESCFYAARMDFTRRLREGADATDLLRRALTSVSERGAALRMLIDLDDARRRALFPTLVDLASVETRHLLLVRQVILTIDPDWLAEHLPVEVERILDSSPEYDMYRRLAQLLQAARSPHLARLVERAAASDDLDTREVADDFS